MDAETIINLYDSYWFFLDFFNNRNQPSNNNLIPEIPSSNQEIPILPTIHTKLKSPINKISSIFSPRKMSNYSASPNSVLESQSPKLQTIFSGKVSDDFEESKEITEINSTTTTATAATTTTTQSSSKTEYPTKGNKNPYFESRRNKNKKKRGLSKSLSDLEFEELKGFIDLGFVFSEEDCESNLVSIIPGLQRLGIKNSLTTISNNNIDIDYSQNNNNNNNIHIEDNANTSNNNNNNNKTYVDKVNAKEKRNMVAKSAVAISRPYLSESWDVLEKKRREDYLTNWRIPTPNNQDQMKDNLRFWAHAVASTVR